MSYHEAKLAIQAARKKAAQLMVDLPVVRMVAGVLESDAKGLESLGDEPGLLTREERGLHARANRREAKRLERSLQ